MELKIIEAAAKRLAKSSIENRPSLASFSAVVDYCRTAMAFLDHEEFRVLFLDKKNHLIADEVQGVGTVDHAPVYPREIMRRALELSASAIIFVHNHPSGDPHPSTDDIHLTHQIIAVSRSPRPFDHRQARACKLEGAEVNMITNADSFIRNAANMARLHAGVVLWRPFTLSA